MKTLRSKDGQVIFKKIKAKVFSPGNSKCFVREHRAPAGRGITEEGIANYLKNVSDAIEKLWPGHEYRLVELAANSFNFVWVRELPAL